MFVDILHDYDLRAFRKWENKLTSYDYYRLSKENEKELTNVAERMKIRFPSLLSNEYNSSEVYKESQIRNVQIRSRQYSCFIEFYEISCNFVFQFKYAELKGASNYFALGLFDYDNSSRFWLDNTKVDPVFQVIFF